MIHYDVVVAGGGPAGSTVAALVKQYSPHLRILLLEKAIFPRHHVGESLLPGASPVLKEMGAYEAIEGHGFPEKLGAMYVWGRDRQPWGFEFDALLKPFFEQGIELPQVYTKGWQVERSVYDHLLLQNAEAKEVEVRQGAQVLEPICDSKRIVGVRYADAQGKHEVSCTWFLDCTGQDALLGRNFGLRQPDPEMDNYALYGYWRGAKWKTEYVGFPQLTRIFVATSPRGWIWYIPVRADLISVGLVTKRQILKEARLAPETLYFEEINTCPEIADLLESACLERIDAGQIRDVLAVQDWSYNSRQYAGSGWAMVGDAAGFVDPILSSGVMLAHELGQKAAYAVNSSFRASNDREIETYWHFYAETYRTYLKAYRDMAAFWYSNNFSMESWWWQARRLVEGERSQIDRNDRDAFNRLAAGYANRAESLSLFGSYPLREALLLVDGLFGNRGNADDMLRKLHGQSPRLHSRARLTTGLYFFQGFIRSTQRILNTESGDYLDLHPAEEVLIGMMNGNHALADINRTADRIRSLDKSQRLPVRSGTELAVQLESIGALD